MKHNRPIAKRPTTKGKETMRNTRNGTRTLAAAAVALLAFVALPPAVEAAEWSIFGSWYDSSQLEDALGFGVRGSFPVNEAWEFDVTISYYEDFEDAIPGSGKVEIGTSGDANRYAELTIGTLADTNGLSMSADEAFDIGQGGKGVVDIGTEGITQLEVVLTTSTTTGIGFTNIVISWW